MADETDRQSNQERPRQFFFDVTELPGRTNVDIMGDSAQAQPYFDLFGRDLVTRTILNSPELSVYHETAAPGEKVKPHRHGTHQLNYILRGELIFGRRRVGAGMGFFTPNLLYSWRAGDDGAEWIEIHAGQPGIFVDQRST
ncbi:Cupin 2 conserved barrel domain protein [Frankia sp. Hr75.2]|nr:Cupin 2 conserved barrel domain protein [Frankia sp. Hr75.2]